MGLFDFWNKKDKKEEDALKGRLTEGLEKTRTSLLGKLSKALLGKSKIDDEVLDELEEILITSDVGVNTTVRIIERIEKRAAEEKYLGQGELQNLLREEIAHLLKKHDQNAIDWQGETPYVIMVVGVNGVGKTTTIGKLAHLFQESGKKVILGAADTFRAAAVDQLKIWSERSGAGFVAKGMNTDPASVAFDAVKAGVEQNADVVIIDTAGRLHNKINLMNELAKIKRVMSKVIPEAPHEVMLVLDASTGQNAFEQAKQFTAATDVSSLALTKLDGTAKGGVVIGISDQFQIPVKYIGVGEKMHDLQIFEARSFVDSMFDTA